MQLWKIGVLAGCGALIALAVAQAQPKMPAGQQPAASLSARSQSEAGLWKSDPLLKQYAQSFLSRQLPVGTDGAVAANQQQPDQVQVGLQRNGYDIIESGVTLGDKQAIELGVRAFEWAFQRQRPDGSFGVSAFPEVVTFLGSYAHAILFLQDAGYKEAADRLGRYVPQIQRALANAAFQQQQQRWQERERREAITNQLFWVGLSYLFIDRVQKSPLTGDYAGSLLQQGLSNQQPDGVFPEKGGSDTTYQGLSLRLLSLYSLYSPQARTLIQPSLERGFRWLAAKVQPGGTMDFSSNTRTGKNQETDYLSGKVKQGRYGNPIAFVYWSYLGGGETARQLAQQIAQAAQRKL